MLERRVISGGNVRHGACPLFQWATAAALAGLLCVTLSGCGAADADGQAADDFSTSESSNEALFGNVMRSLLHLDTRVDMGLPTEIRIVSDATTTNQLPAKAVLKASIAEPGKFDLVEITSGNAQLKENQVKKGDYARFIGEKPQFDPEELIKLQQQGIDVPHTAQQINLRIVEVLDDNRLRVQGRAPTAIDPPLTFEVIRRIPVQAIQIRDRLKAWKETGRPALVWHPSPDDGALKQIVNRLNQWARNSEPEGAWSPDPLVGTLDERFQKLPQYKNLGGIQFDYQDGRLMQEAVWLRDVASNVTSVGKYPGLDDVRLRQAYELFDWVVRHIQLEKSGDVAVEYIRPWQTLLYGCGTAQQRAWLFTLLARQKGLEVVALTPEQAGDDSKITKMLSGLVIDKKIYLFDAALGMPMPGPKGQGIATLEQAISDPSVLALMTLAADADDKSDEKKSGKDQSPTAESYFTADQLKKVDAWVEGSPNYLARRMQTVEGRLIGSRKFVMTARPSAVAEQLKSHPNVARVALWPIAAESLIGQQAYSKSDRDVVAKQFELFARRPKLWKGRVLQFQGVYNDVSPGDKQQGIVQSSEGAKSFYLDARHPAALIQSYNIPPRAKELLTDETMYASYWISLMLMDENEWKEAESWLRLRVIKAFPKGTFLHGGKYNLGRAFEAQGRIDTAISVYKKDTSSPQAYGNQVRAKWLRLLHPKAKQDDPPPLDDPPIEDAKPEEGKPNEESTDATKLDATE